ncbi:DUF2784 domain-containing protein [Marinitenerispora sediminis]|uniref:DUF2784 domain-containing protein n=2 Tax=Marinitenerispora sediminis TaxID=1931232 RepID=A0A368T1D5_9ACTN|nr:DUF2784 domain-containing protein [Marinitenerispora sediminis]RCV47385.1 DUF2784 domain-containing protein [Marinitenerispora sediminis]RCV47465.1 DUF2784 domain-containing protein [Marinitenerispora sediminis]RCV54086.1 DUF2784 domain-containing protein [Marinitenerispora sediminis]
MGYRVLGEAAMLAHFCFLGYLVVGGFFAWRWPRAVWPHVLVAGYGLGILVIGWTCPLTVVEDWARVRAGGAGLGAQGFIAHYLTGVLYPADAIGAVRLLVALVVALSWAGAVLRWRHRRTRPGPVRRPAVPPR